MCPPQDTSAAAAELGITTSNFPPKPAAAAPAADGGGGGGYGGGASAADAAAAAASAAAPSGPQPKSGTLLTAVENTDKVHNLVVCTLCSCYPISVLGMSPPWYRSRWGGGEGCPSQHHVALVSL